MEERESEAELEGHIRSEAFRRVLGAMEHSVSPPAVRFDFVSTSKGMELIRSLRDAG